MAKDTNQINQSLVTIGERIEKIMYSKRIIISELSQKSGVNKVVVYKILRGDTYNMSSLIKVLEALEISIVLIGINK